MSHWITSHTELRYQLSGSDDTNQSDSFSTKQQSDEMLKDIKAIAELEPSGIIHIAVLFLFTNCVNFIYSAVFSY